MEGEEWREEEDVSQCRKLEGEWKEERNMLVLASTGKGRVVGGGYGNGR